MGAPKWEALYEKAYPTGNTIKTPDIPKIDIPISGPVASTKIPWVAIGIIVVIVGITIVVIRKQKQASEK